MAGALVGTGFVVDRPVVKPVMKRKRVQVKEKRTGRISAKEKLARILEEHEAGTRGTISGAEMKRTFSLLRRRSNERLRFLDKN